MALLSAVLTALALLVLRRSDEGRVDRLLPGRRQGGPRPGCPRPGSARPRSGRASGPLRRKPGGIPAPPGAGGGPGRGSGSVPGGLATAGWLPSPPVLACAVGGAALALLLVAPAGPALGLALAVAGPRLLARLEPAGARAERAALVADLPLLLDLLSSCLAGGAALPEAARAVAAAVPGPAGERLAAVSAQLAVGTPPSQAWLALTGHGDHLARPGPAGAGRGRRARTDDPLAPAARALGRAAEGGAPVAAAVARLAADARAQARAGSELAARRVGVLVVAPLGLCFLPAFVLLGVVPVVAGLVGPLLATF